MTSSKPALVAALEIAEKALKQATETLIFDPSPEGPHLVTALQPRDIDELYCVLSGALAPIQQALLAAPAGRASPTSTTSPDTPEWMLTIHDFDGLEIWPCCVVGFADDREFVETCEPDAAHFWTVYGHLREGGLSAFEDFATPEAARSFAARLLDTYPHLRHHGLSDNS